MTLNNDQLKEMLAYEAFIRRASELNLPFMLKGSYVTRQYFSNPKDRVPADLDWLYLEKLSVVDESRALFNDWATQLTELKMDDGVEFRSFMENPFWRNIDYAMIDDFPTVNTDLSCWVDGAELYRLPVDISFNLDVDCAPVPLLYKPLRGNVFTIPYTVPLALQVSWKIHQTLIRPRFKDLLDLTHLLRHPSFNEETLQQSLRALVKESNAGDVPLYRLQFLLSGDIDRLYDGSMRASWDLWRHNIKSPAANRMFYEKAEDITDSNQLPYNLSEFLCHFYVALRAAGFKPALTDTLLGSWKNHKGYVKRMNDDRELAEEDRAITKWSSFTEDTVPEIPVSQSPVPDENLLTEAQIQSQLPPAENKNTSWIGKLTQLFRPKK